MKRIIVIGLSFIIFSCNLDENKERVYSLTGSEIMEIYESGYIKGSINVLVNNNYSNELWSIDSTEMIMSLKNFN